MGGFSDFLSGPGGGIISAGLDFLGNKSLQEDAQSFARVQAKNQIQWRVADLQKAGLNPMLAYMGGGGGASAAATPGPAIGHFTGNSAAAAERLASMKLVQAQTDKVDSEKRVNDALAAKYGSETAVSNMTVPKIAQEISESVARTGVAQSQHGLNQIEAEIKGMDRQKLEAIMPSLIELVKNEAYRSKLGLPSAENMSAVEHTFWGKIAAFVRAMFGTSSASGAAALLQAIK